MYASQLRQRTPSVYELSEKCRRVVTVGDEREFADLPRWIANATLDGVSGPTILPLADRTVVDVDAIRATALANAPDSSIPLYIKRPDKGVPIPPFQMYEDVLLFDPGRTQRWNGCYLFRASCRKNPDSPCHSEGITRFSLASHDATLVTVHNLWMRAADLRTIPEELIARIAPAMVLFAPVLQHAA